MKGDDDDYPDFFDVAVWEGLIIAMLILAIAYIIDVGRSYEDWQKSLGHMATSCVNHGGVKQFNYIGNFVCEDGSRDRVPSMDVMVQYKSDPNRNE